MGKNTKTFRERQWLWKTKKIGKNMLAKKKSVYLQPKRAETFQTGGIPKSHKSRKNANFMSL